MHFKSSLFFVFTIILISISIFIISLKQDSLPVKQELISTNSSAPKYLVYTPGCQMPDLSNFPKIGLGKQEPIICEYQNSSTPLVLSDESSIWVNEGALTSYGINDSRNVTCCYAEMYRVKPKPNETLLVSRNTCKRFWKREKIFVEFVRINCSYNKKDLYTDFHFFLPIKEEDDKPLADSSPDQSKVNVLVLGLDSISKFHFQRTMKKTASFLLNNLSAIEMFGYNKVGHNTYPNLVPMLTGLRFGSEFNSTTNQLLWNKFKSFGYRTALIEDSRYDSISDHFREMLQKSPTNYYSSPFYKTAVEEIGTKNVSLNFCIGTKPLYESLLDYADKFVRSMKNHPYFGFIWQSSLMHEGLAFSFLADDLYYSFLKRLSTYSSFNKTILIFVSDHGFQRWGAFTNTKMSLVEDRHPLMFFAFPLWFREKYSKALNNLKINGKRLVTAFDFYETLKDLASCSDNLNEEILEQRIKVLDNKKLPKGISLFLPIPPRRTCVDAGIREHFCGCVSRIPVSINESFVQYVAEHAVRYVNKIISPYSQCAKVKLEKILDANIPIPFSSNFDVGLDCRIIVQMAPGAMKFEATVIDVKNKFTNKINESEKVIEDINTISTYRDHSLCVDDKIIKSFCFCVSNL